MDKYTFDFIFNCLFNELNSLKATDFYITHQLSLPESLRVMQDDEEKVKTEHRQIKLQIIEYEQAIKELTKCQGLFLSGNPT